VLCFSHKLELLWQRAVDADMAGRFLDEVAILVTPHPMRVRAWSCTGRPLLTRATQPHDIGTVIVGGRLRERDDQRLHTMRTVQRERKLKCESERHAALGAGRRHVCRGQLGVRTATTSSGWATRQSARCALARWWMLGCASRAVTLGRASHTTSMCTPSRARAASCAGSRRFALSPARPTARPEAALAARQAGDFHEEVHPHDMLRPQHEALSGEMDWRNFRDSVTFRCTRVARGPVRPPAPTAHLRACVCGTQPSSSVVLPRGHGSRAGPL
jgi:hypothetical protein